MKRISPAVWPVAIGAGAILGAGIASKVWGWEGAVAFDGWAYTMWGQAVAELERPLYTAAQTTPKPFGILLIAPFALFGRSGFVVVVSLLLATLFVVLAVTAYLRWGSAGAGLATVAMASAVPLHVAFEFSDAATAVLVMSAVATRGPKRITLLILAGLFRPEAWLLAGAATAFHLKKEPVKALLWTPLAAIAAPVLWMLLDTVLVGDPLATIRWTDFARDERAAGGAPVEATSISDIPRAFFDVFTGRPFLGLVVVAGTIGWIAAARRKEAGFSAWVPWLWCLGIGLGMTMGLVLRERYLLSAAAVWALGCGALIPRSLSLKVGRALAVAGIAAGIAVLLVPNLDTSRTRAAIRERDTRASMEAIDEVMRCGKLAITGSWRARDAIPFIAGIGEHPATRLYVVADGGEQVDETVTPAAVLRLHRVEPLPTWPRYRLPLGRLAVNPRCSFGVSDYPRSS